jgi:hypothetical protein
MTSFRVMAAISAALIDLLQRLPGGETSRAWLHILCLQWIRERVMPDRRLPLLDGQPARRCCIHRSGLILRGVSSGSLTLTRPASPRLRRLDGTDPLSGFAVSSARRHYRQRSSRRGRT